MKEQQTKRGGEICTLEFTVDLESFKVRRKFHKVEQIYHSNLPLRNRSAYRCNVFCNRSFEISAKLAQWALEEYFEAADVVLRHNTTRTNNEQIFKGN